MPESVHVQLKCQLRKAQDKSINVKFYKTLRTSFNCIANMLAQDQSAFVKNTNPKIFKLLQREFDYMMLKIKTLHKSKRFIS